MKKRNSNLEQTCIIVLLLIILAFIIVTLGLAAYNTGFTNSIVFILSTLFAYGYAERECMRAKDPKFLRILEIIITLVALCLIINAAYL